MHTSAATATRTTRPTAIRTTLPHRTIDKPVYKYYTIPMVTTWPFPCFLEVSLNQDRQTARVEQEKARCKNKFTH